MVGIINYLKNKEILNDRRIIFIILSIIIFFTYFPLMKAYYMFSDDYLYFFPKVGEYDGYLTSTYASIFDYSMDLGRPLLFCFIALGNKLIINLEMANFLRFFAIIALIIVSYIFVMWAKYWRIKTLDALLIAIIMATTPVMNVSVAWITCNLLIYGLLFSCVSVILINKSIKIDSGTKRSIYTALSIIFLLISLGTYQPAAMFYWVMVAVLFVSDGFYSWNKQKREILRYYDIGIFSIILYLILFLLFNSITDYIDSGKINVVVFGQGRASFTLDLIGKINWFLRIAIHTPMNFLTLYSYSIVSSTVFLVIISFILLEYRFNNNLNNEPSDKPRSSIEHSFGLTSKLIRLILFIFWIYLLTLSSHVIGYQSTNPYILDQYSIKAFIVVISYFILLSISLIVVVTYKNCIKLCSQLLNGVVSFIKRQYSDKLIIIFERLIFLFILVSLSFSPILLSNLPTEVPDPSSNISIWNSTTSYRIYIALTPLFILLFYGGLRGIKIIQPKLRYSINIVLIIISLTSVYTGKNVIIKYYSVPQSIEAKYLKNMLSEGLNENTRNIHVYRSKLWTGMVPINIGPGSEIGTYSSSVGSNTVNMVICMINEIRKDNNNIGESNAIPMRERIMSNFTITTSILDEKKSFHNQIPMVAEISDDATLFIDMTELNRFH